MDFLFHPHFAPLLAMIAVAVLGVGLAARGGSHPEHAREFIVCGLIVLILSGVLKMIHA